MNLKGSITFQNLLNSGWWRPKTEISFERMTSWARKKCSRAWENIIRQRFNNKKAVCFHVPSADFS